MSRTTLYSLIRRGSLAAVYVAADLRVPADAITAYLSAHLVPVTARSSARQRSGHAQG